MVGYSSRHWSCFTLSSQVTLGSHSTFTGTSRMFESTSPLVPFRKKQKSPLAAPENVLKTGFLTHSILWQDSDSI